MCVHMTTHVTPCVCAYVHTRVHVLTLACAMGAHGNRERNDDLQPVTRTGFLSLPHGHS